MYVFHKHPRRCRTTTDRCYVGQLTINKLPEDILLYIFNVYVNDPYLLSSYKTDVWVKLVHVCQRWRNLVFGSPRHLNLRLLCTTGTQVTKKLDIWPVLPISVEQYETLSIYNIIAAIKHYHRVCKIDLRSPIDIWQLEEIVSVMQVPFPALTDLKLVVQDIFERMAIIPDSFMSGSAPRLQHLSLEGISFPGLPRLLLSATDLVYLELRRIPHSWYIPPDAIVTHLSSLSRLESFILEFASPQSRPDAESRQSPPPARTLLPTLTQLTFKGVSEYVEDLLILIDTPLLDNLHIAFFNEAIFDVTHLCLFMNRKPFQGPDEARVIFSDEDVKITFSSQTRAIGFGQFTLEILCDESVGQLSSLIQLCRWFSPSLAMVKRLYISKHRDWEQPRWQDGNQHSHWLQLLHFFTGVKYLYLSRELTPCIAPTLQTLIGERTMEVLPALQNLFFYKFQLLWGTTDIGDFIAARELSGHPITVSCSWSGWYTVGADNC
jgi:hypothetical protein